LKLCTLISFKYLSFSYNILFSLSYCFSFYSVPLCSIIFLFYTSLFLCCYSIIFFILSSLTLCLICFRFVFVYCSSIMFFMSPLPIGYSFCFWISLLPLLFYLLSFVYRIGSILVSFILFNIYYKSSKLSRSDEKSPTKLS